MSDVDDRLASLRATDKIVDAALEAAAEILAPPEPDPRAVLAAPEIPALLTAEPLEVHRDRGCRGDRKQRHRRKVARVLEAKARACRRAGQPLDAPDVVA